MILSEYVSLLIHILLSKPTSSAKPKFTSALAPRSRAGLTSSYAITLSPPLAHYSFNFSLIFLPSFLCRNSTVLSIKFQMTTPINPTPIYLLSTPMIQPFSLHFSKNIFVQFKCPNTRRRDND